MSIFVMLKQRRAYRNNGISPGKVRNVKPKSILKKPEKGALDNISCRIGNNACATKHESAIQRSGLLSPMNEDRRNSSLLWLQRRYGNRFVQKVIARNAIQAKLKVGQPRGKFEQEADRVAEQVMRMSEPKLQRQPEEEEEELLQTKPLAEQIIPLAQRQVEEEEEEGELLQTKPLAEQIIPLVQRQVEEEEEEELQTKELPSQIPEVTPNLEARIKARGGSGQPLPASTRAFFETRFGYDFSQVRLHTDTEADALSRSLNSHAFTAGRNIFFRQGEYNAGSSDGQKLLSHELTHVLQQTGKLGLVKPSLIQRKIIVGGTDYTPTGRYFRWLRVNNYGNAMVEFIKDMHNNGNPPEYKFDSYEQMGYEVKVRHNAIKGMEEVHKGCCSYATGGGTGYLDSAYWDKVGFYQFTVKSPLPPGKEASDAIEAIFKSGAGTELECNSIMVAIQYRAMLKALGESEFNSKFPAGSGIIISPHHVPPAGVALHPIWQKNLYEHITISGAADLMPGDWVYFKNISDYILKHPGGLWTGEHAMYMGRGKFRGFGVQNLTEADMNKELLDAYNAGLPDAEKKVLADVPGLQDYARRPVIKEITR